MTAALISARVDAEEAAERAEEARAELASALDAAREDLAAAEALAGTAAARERRAVFEDAVRELDRSVSREAKDLFLQEMRATGCDWRFDEHSHAEWGFALPRSHGAGSPG